MDAPREHGPAAGSAVTGGACREGACPVGQGDCASGTAGRQGQADGDDMGAA